MRECKVFLDDSNVDQVLDTYTQMCNISVNTDSLATMAATLANGGICPTTGNSPLPNCGYIDSGDEIGDEMCW